MMPGQPANPLMQLLLQRHMAGGGAPGGAMPPQMGGGMPHPSVPHMAVPHAGMPRPFSRPVSSGLRPAALMPRLSK